MAFQNTAFQNTAFQIAAAAAAVLPLTLGNYQATDQTVVITSAYGSPAVLLASLNKPFNQNDWPNPRGPVRTFQLSWEDHSTLFQVPVQRQYDWPNPAGPQRRNEQLGFQEAGNALTGVADDPRKQLDWPNPRGRQPLNVGFTDSRKLPTSVPGFNQKDWPNPRGAKPAVFDWKASFLLPLQTLVPENQYDWPNPKLPRRNEQLGFTGSGLGLGSVVVVPATITFDWPNPRGPAQYNRSFTDSFKLPLAVLGQSVLIDGPSFVDPPRQFQVSASPVTLLTAVQAPFKQTDWPNPRGAKPAVFDWEDSFKLPLQTIVPENQYDWPVPKGGRRSGDLGWYQTGLAQTTVIVQPFPYSQDWPNPRLPVATPRGFTDSFKLPLQTIVPENQYDWPNPRGAKSVDGFVNPALTFATSAADPRRQLDWPVPRGPQPLNRGWTDSFKLPLQTLVPQKQYDWPVPRGPRRSGDLGWYDDGLARETVVVQPFPFAKDWPNPRLPVATPRGFTDSFKLPLQSIRPHKQHDWPVPQPPRRITALGHIDRAQPDNIPAAVFEDSPQQPVTGSKLLRRSLLVSTTGPNIVLGYPFAPPPEPIVPALAKQSRGGIRSARSTTSSRWRKSRGNIRSSRSRTTPKDDP